MGDVANIWIKAGCSFAVLAAVALTYKFLKPNSGRVPKIHGLYWAVTISTVLLVPEDVASYVFTALTVTLVGAIYPIHRAIKACCTPYEGDDKEWLQFWMIGGVLFMATTWVNDVMQDERIEDIWFGFLIFAFFWLYFPLTCGARLIYDGFTEPFLGPRVKALQQEMTTFILYVQAVANALHIYLVWMFFMILPAGSKRFIAIALGTVYPSLSSITATASDEMEDVTYWLTYWSAYGCLFVIMDILETWLGQIPGFYALMILITVYLMLPMFRGADKVFRNILVPLAGLKEMLILRDSYRIKKQMLRDLDPERAKIVGRSVSQIFEERDDEADPAELHGQLKRSWYGLKMPFETFNKHPMHGNRPPTNRKYEQPPPTNPGYKINLV
mmetsp:Transcript_21822/g.52761  ORF Transcript_21822/g.52761 Transcript_21822/m.52761 type:complete len:386 (+) Transcript_21822:130-1287(+)